MIRKIKYYLMRLTRMDWKGLKEGLNYAHEKSSRNRVILFFDMMYCSVKYLAGYVDYNEFEFYNLTNKQRKTFITTGQSHKVAYAYNDSNYTYIFNDKSIFNKKFSKYVHRAFIDLRDTDAQGLESFVREYTKVMAKRTNDYVGRGIDKIDISETPDLNFEQLYKDLIANDQFLIEEFFKQHETMNKLSDKSVNTIRMITFLDNDGEPHLFVAALKSGLGGHVDNIGQGGMYTILDDSGTVSVAFIDKYGKHHTAHPITGESLIGFQIPNYFEVLSQVYEAAKLMPQVRYIGWDVAISQSGDAELIEGNTTTGPFQVIPSLSKDPRGVRPEYEKYVDIKL